MAESGLIDSYLARLRDRLGRGDQATAEINEIGDHLHEAAAHEMAAGHTADEAAVLAIRRIGDVEVLAQRLRVGRLTLPAPVRRISGVVGLFAAALLGLTLVAEVYLTTRGWGQRPRVELVRIGSVWAGTAALAAFLILQARRLTGLSRMVATTAIAGSFGVLALSTYAVVRAGYGSWSTPQLPWIAVGLPLVEAVAVGAAVALTLRPWAALEEPRWSRWALTIGVVGYLAVPGATDALVLTSDQLSVIDMMGAFYWATAGMLLAIVAGLVGTVRPLLRSPGRALRRATA